MGIKQKKFNNQIFEVLEHGEVPGYRRAFHIVFCVAVIYFIFIFLH